MSFEFNPADEDPHGECRHEIQRLTAVNEELLAACKAAIDDERYVNEIHPDVKAEIEAAIQKATTPETAK